MYIIIEIKTQGKLYFLSYFFPSNCALVVFASVHLFCWQTHSSRIHGKKNMVISDEESKTEITYCFFLFFIVNVNAFSEYIPYIYIHNSCFIVHNTQP